MAYKVDTLVVNRRIDEERNRNSRLICLGKLTEVADRSGVGAKNTNSVKRALRQNASTFISAKIAYKGLDGTEKTLEADFSRYSVIFTGERLPDGKKADAVYIILNDIYWQVLNDARNRPLDYDYLKNLPPGPQRFYELVSFEMFAALRHNHRAKLVYSEYCTYAPQTRYADYDHVKKQMYKIHRPHIQSGYLSKVEFKASRDGEGAADWEMYYTPGPKARAEFDVFTRKQKASESPVAREGREALPFPPLQNLPMRELAVEDALGEPEDDELVHALAAAGLNRDDARRLSETKRGECERQLKFLPYKRPKNPGAWLKKAIEGEYAPPPDYLREERRAERQREAEAAASEREALQRLQTARQGEIFAYLGESMARMQSEHPEAFSAFNAHSERGLQKTLRTLRSEKGMENYRRVFEGEGARLKRFAEYFRTHESPIPELRAWLDEHPEPTLRIIFTE
jgi:hypothetical protein